MPVNIRKITTLTGHAGSIYALVQDPQDKQLFFSGSGDGTVIQWNLSDFSKAVLKAKVDSNIFSIHMLVGNHAMLIGQMAGGIHVIDLNEKKEIKHLALHQQGVFDLWSAGDFFYSAGGDGVLAIWNARDCSLHESFKISEKSIRNFSFHPGKKIAALGCSDNCVYVLSTKDFKAAHKLTGHQNSVFATCFSPDGRHLVTGSRDAHLRVWDTDDFTMLKSIPAHLFTINCIVYSPDGKYLATASRDKTIKIWDAGSFELLKVIDKEKHDGHVNSVNKLLWCENHRYLVSCSDDRSIMVWEVGF